IEQENGELYAIECNPRATSGIHLFNGDAQFVRCFIQPCQAVNGELVTPKLPTKKMLAAAMLTEGLLQIRHFSQLQSWLADFRSASDVIVTRKDLAPSLEQFRVAAALWKMSRKNKVTLQQATTIDIEWNGDP